MFDLLPSEHWDYGSADMGRGLVTAAFAPRHDALEGVALPGFARCLPIRSARAAIVLALKVLALPAGARVGVPLYCCPVVFKAIKAAGCSPRFIDIDPSTYCLSVPDLAAKSNELDAIVAVHMFGNLCDVPRLRDAAPGKPVIEDCAQALGSRLHDRPAGSYGEVAVFSVRSGKYLSVGEGGGIYTPEADLETRLSEFVRALPVPGRVDECRHVLATYLRSALRSRPLWGLVGSRLWDTYSKNVSYPSQSPLVMGRLYESDRDMARRRVPCLDSWIDRQRANCDYYQRNLVVDEGRLCSEPPGCHYNRLQFPLLVPTPEQCSRLAAFLREKGIGTARPYREIAGIAAAHYGYSGDCPVAERVASTVLVIPCHHALEPADVERVALNVNLAWGRASGRGPVSVI